MRVSELLTKTDLTRSFVRTGQLNRSIASYAFNMRRCQAAFVGLILALVVSVWAQPRKHKQGLASIGPTTPKVVAVRFSTGPAGNMTSTDVLWGDPIYYFAADMFTRKQKFPMRYRGRLVASNGIVLYRFINGRPVIIDLERGRNAIL